MRKISFLLAFLALLGLQVHGQRQVTGTVTHAEDGSSIPGVSVLVKGTQVGTVTDINGKYSINVPPDGKVLQFSFVGMQTVEVTIGNQTVIDVQMQPTVSALEGVIVTALGISREKKSLGYAVQDVSGDEITQARQLNAINSLSGRVAGLQITTGSGNMAGSSRVLIRGVNSISGNNNPLYVIDGIPIDNSDFNTVNTARGAGGIDYGNMAQDVNSDDIESISVLKGPAAAALYGSRAANGVILITTKKGKADARRGIGVSINSGINIENVAYLPKFQNLYGGGTTFSGPGTRDGFLVQEINGIEYLLPDYATDESWGPRYNPNIYYLPYWSLYDWEALGKPATNPDGTPYRLETVPWVAPGHDVEDFFETSVGYTNNIALTSANENGSFRLSYTNFSSNGYMPNSTLNRNSINFNGASKFGKKLQAFTSINYIKTYALGRPATGYDDNNVLQKFVQWGQRQLDMEKAKNYMNPDGTQRTWNRRAWNDPVPNYSDNPYWTRFMNYEEDWRDRYYGNVGLTYQIFDWLKLTGKYNLDTYTFRINERVAIGSQALPYYQEDVRQVTETNAEFLLEADKRFGDDFSTKLTLGGNRMHRQYELNGGITQGGLVIKNFYNLSNSLSPALVHDETTQKSINSLYGSLNLGYKGLLYLDVTLRNDWSSTLPKNNWSYLYPSATLSYVFSEMPGLQNQNWFNFGKLRFGWAKVGNDTDPYRLITLYQNIQNFGSDIIYTLPATLNNAELKPENTNGWEVGTELRFLDNRIGLDFTYYYKKTSDQIFNTPISAASGFTSAMINAGSISNKGIEFLLTLTPVKVKDFTWDILLNFAKNTNKVEELTEGVESLRLSNGPFNISVEAREGEAYGQLVGTDFVYDAQGNKVVGTNGRYLKTTAVQSLGSVLPDWNAGINNTFKFKGFDFSALIDIQHGGKIFSTSYMWGIYSGMLEESAAINANGKNIRDDVADGGGVLIDGVYGKLNADGSVTYLDKDGNPVDSPVKNETYISGLRWASDHYSGPAAQNVFDASYVKLRELRLGYTIPNRYTGPIQNLRISVYGRNLAIWGRDNQHIDPEYTTSAGNIQGIEGGQLPSLRSFGINLSCNF
ncbi:MAG TPA: SusC/RagA family TonB-linked outer membrane protein [Bacteroidales bacterium]|nr:SusC/RagA family TonB-linked outer membrane protein [Bacteroidales bacterium]